MSASHPQAPGAPRGDSHPVDPHRSRRAAPCCRRSCGWRWRLHITANMVTVFGLLIVIAATILVGTGYLLIGALVLGFGSALDAVDGSLARASGGHHHVRRLLRLHARSGRGGDPVQRRGRLLPAFSDDPTIPVLLAMVALTGSFLVSYSRARAEGIGLSAEVGLAPRVERLVLIVLGIGLAGFGFDWALIGALAIIAALAVFTTVQRIWHVYRLTSGAPQGATTTAQHKGERTGWLTETARPPTASMRATGATPRTARSGWRSWGWATAPRAWCRAATTTRTRRRPTSSRA